MTRGSYDFIVVGGGAVGLHAALKAAVLRHSVLVLDKGVDFARVAQAPAIANIPGSPGISGRDLLLRLREDLRAVEELAGEGLVEVWDGVEAHDAEKRGEEFVVRARDAEGREREATARALVLATGIVDRKPGISDFHKRGHPTLAPYVHGQEIGYCVLCEGWDLRDKTVGVVGCSPDSVQIATDVHEHFGANVTLLTDSAVLDPKETEEELRAAGVDVDARPIDSYGQSGARACVRFGGGGEREFEKLIFALGLYRVNNELAVKLGAATTSEGYVRTDGNSEVLDPEGRRIRGLFAVGDLRADRWKQIVVGWGDAETAVITAYAKRIPW